MAATAKVTLDGLGHKGLLEGVQQAPLSRCGRVSTASVVQAFEVGGNDVVHRAAIGITELVRDPLVGPPRRAEIHGAGLLGPRPGRGCGAGPRDSVAKLPGSP